MVCRDDGDKEAKSEDGRRGIFKIKRLIIGGIKIKWIKIKYFPVNVSLKIGRVYNLDIAYNGNVLMACMCTVFSVGGGSFPVVVRLFCVFTSK
jgi:hypothetical protein